MYTWQIVSFFETQSVLLYKSYFLNCCFRKKVLASFKIGQYYFKVSFSNNDIVVFPVWEYRVWLVTPEYCVVNRWFKIVEISVT